MSASATLPASNPVTTISTTRPIVVVNGRFDPRLRVDEYSVQGPLDRRTAKLSIIDPIEGAPLPATGACIDIKHALRLTDGSTRSETLLSGEIEDARVSHAVDNTQRSWRLDDAWTMRLQAPLERVWRQSGDLLLSEQSDNSLRLKIDSRSTRRWTIAGRLVYVLQDRAETWRIGELLTTILAFAGCRITIDLLPNRIRETRLSEGIDLRLPLGAILEAVCERYGLYLERESKSINSDGHPHVIARSRSQGRRVEYAPDHVNLRDDFSAISRQMQPVQSRKWIARGDGRIIESTFTLAGGWDPALEGQAAGEYQRTTSSDFARYANVFRNWVLNEDGFYSEAPYLVGDPFDLAAFFGESSLTPRPLKFDDNLILDDIGRRRAPLVEISTDSGANWADYTGRRIVSNDRCAVYLDDDDLDSAFIAAAKTGNARVRITASIQSPIPVEFVRWQGNPFGRIAEPRIVDISQLFRFGYVANDSVQAAALESGDLDVLNTANETEAAHWLAALVTRDDPVDDGQQHLNLYLAADNPLLRPGDRIRIDTAGNSSHPLDLRIDNRSHRSVRSIRCRWPGDESAAITLTEIHLTP